MKLPGTQDILTLGIHRLDAERQEYESTKRGWARGGSAGAILGNGQVIGGCHRKAYARMIGASEPRPPEDDLRRPMLDGGNANEEVWAEQLGAGLEGTEFIILREEEIPECERDLGDGRMWGGRPDVAFATRHGQEYELHRGIELKKAESIWTIKDVIFGNCPKTVHVIQAGAYMSHLEVPFELWYTNQSNFVVPASADPKRAVNPDGTVRLKKDGTEYKISFPPQGWDMCELVEYFPDGNIKNIKPCQVGYQLRFSGRDRRLEFKRMPVYLGGGNYGYEGDWVPTEITEENIWDFYRYVHDIGQLRDLGPRPARGKKLDGNPSYSPCDYCGFSDICDEYESDYNKWRAQVQQLMEE